MIKRYVEKRCHEAAQAQVTVTPVDTVHHCSPCPLNPEMPPDVCMRLESNERGCNLIFLFLGRALVHGRLVACTSCFLSVFACMLCSLIVVLLRRSLLSELKSKRGDADQVADVHNRRASISRLSTP